MTAAALKARASVGADIEGVASVDASVDSSASVRTPTDRGLAPLRPAPERQPPPPPSNETNETNETAPQPQTNETPPPGPEPVPNETADAPATFDPREQDMRGQAGAPLRFVVLLTNTAKTTQNVTLTVKAPAGWDVRLSPEGALLGADETVPIHGTITTPAMVGTSGTVAIFGRGDGGEDVAYVNLCSIGALQSGCGRSTERDERNRTAEPAPPANQTQEDPAPEPQPEPTPPANETQAPPSPPADDPAPAPSPAPEPSSPPSNATASPPSNSTASSYGSSGASSEGSADAEAWVTIEARASGDEDDDESPPPVTLDV